MAKQHKNNKKGIEGRRASIIIGYIAKPVDVDADVFKSDSLRKGTTIITENGEFIQNIPISTHVKSYLVFPTTSNTLGSCVVCVTIDKHQGPIIIGTLDKRDELLDFESDIASLVRGEASVQCKEDGSIIVSSQGTGKVVVVAKDNVSLQGVNSIDIQSKQVQIRINKENYINFEKDSLTLESKNVTIKSEESTHDTDKHIIKASQVDIESSKIAIASKGESAILGESLVQQLTLMSLRIDGIIAAIAAAPVLPGDGGLVFKTSVAAAAAGLPRELFLQVLSKQVKIG